MKLTKQTFGLNPQYLEMIRAEVQESKNLNPTGWISQNEIIRQMCEDRYGPLEGRK